MNIKKLIYALVLIPVAIFAIYGIVLMNFVFGYLNQSSDTPVEDQLTFFNYLLPLIVTIGFIIYLVLNKLFFPLDPNRKNWKSLLFVLICAVIAIPWQLQNLVWIFQRGNIDIFALLPHLTGFVFTLWVIWLHVMRVRNTLEHS